MKTRLSLVFGMAVSLTLISTWVVSAQGRKSIATDDTANQSVSPAASLVPKLFWYERTFGETEVPYFVDTAHIFGPGGVAVDGSGNLWVAEGAGARVLKYSGDSAFLTSIGTAGRFWLADNRNFSAPADVTVDGAGNLWVVDRVSHRVVKYDQNLNYVWQLGVTGEGGSDNSHLSSPRGVACDVGGHIYISDSWNHRVQVFDSTGSYHTTIGVTGVSGLDNSHLDEPYEVAVDQDNRLYVADTGNHRVQVFDTNHSYLATLGTTGVPGSDNSHLNAPFGLTTDANHIYVADSANHRVQIFDRATRSYQFTLGIGGGAGNYQFDWPGGVAVDSMGNIYVADLLNHRVQKFDSSRSFVRTFGITGVPYLTDSYHYNMPSGVAVDGDGNIGIVEAGGRGHRFIKLNSSGVPQFTIGVAGNKGSDTAHFANPGSVAFDAHGNIYVSDELNNRIQVFSSDGTYQWTLGTGAGTGAYQFNAPRGVAVDSGGNIYVADSSNHRVQIYNSSRIHVATLGVTGVSGSDNSHFDFPNDVEADAGGSIYVSDERNGRVQKFSSGRVYQMTLRPFWSPSGVAVDGTGRIYVAEKWNNRVQVYGSGGNFLTTIGVSFGSQVDQFRHPTGVAVDGAGNLYIADRDNHRVQKYIPGELLYLPLMERN